VQRDFGRARLVDQRQLGPLQPTPAWWLHWLQLAAHIVRQVAVAALGPKVLHQVLPQRLAAGPGPQRRAACRWRGQRACMGCAVRITCPSRP